MYGVEAFPILNLKFNGDVLQRQTKFHKDEEIDRVSKVTLCSSEISGTVIFLIRSLSYVP